MIERVMIWENDMLTVSKGIPDRSCVSMPVWSSCDMSGGFV